MSWLLPLPIVLPLLAGYFVWKRKAPAGGVRWMALAFVAAFGLANLYPFTFDGDTEVLFALHLPIALWMVVGVAYSGGRWGRVSVPIGRAPASRGRRGLG